MLRGSEGGNGAEKEEETNAEHRGTQWQLGTEDVSRTAKLTSTLHRYTVPRNYHGITAKHAMKAYVSAHPTPSPSHALTHTQRRPGCRLRRRCRLLRPLLLRRGTARPRGYHEEDPRARELLQCRDPAGGQPVLDGSNWSWGAEDVYYGGGRSYRVVEWECCALAAEE